MNEDADKFNEIPKEEPAASGGFWWPGWWKLMNMRIGVIPVPSAILLLIIILYFLRSGKLPTEICMMIAVIGFGGFVCGEIGARLPLFGNIGGGAVFATFVPSAMKYYGLLPASVVDPVADFTKSTQFIYLFITAIIVGSILGMERNVLIRGFIKIFIPLVIGSITAILVGTLVGAALGLGARHSLLFIIIPIMAGGIGEGAMPLSTGYAPIMNESQDALFAQFLPVVMIANIVAILFAGILNLIGKKHPHLTGNGRIQPDDHTADTSKKDEANVSLDVQQLAAAGFFAITLYLAGLVGKNAFGFPAPVTMIFLSVIVKITNAVPPSMEHAAHAVYRFFRVAVTYPLLFAIGVSLTPWEKVLEAFHWRSLFTIIITITTLVVTGWVVARRTKLHPIEAAIVNACHSGMGGTGDVAILTAANRMELMPFAQIATRIGGAITITLTLIILRLIS